MTRASEAERLAVDVRRAFEALAAERGVDARDLCVRAAAIDAEARFAHAAEERVVADAVPARRREFATGRRIAHELLAELGRPAAPLVPGRRRAPDWPAGVAGSISHAQGLALVAVAPRPPFAAIGLDVEGADELSPALIGAVLTARERERFAGAGGSLGAWAKLAFCAKECAYKAWSPTLEAVPEFSDVEIEFHAGGEGFAARLVPRAGAFDAARTLRGRCARGDGRVWAAALDVGR